MGAATRCQAVLQFQKSYLTSRSGTVNTDMNRIFFTADLHFSHKNVLKHCPGRPHASEDDIRAHDDWLLNLWRDTVDKHDDIYILGDLTFGKSEEARLLLEKLPGRKHLIRGNHDGVLKAYDNYFESVYDILDLKIKPERCPFLKSNLTLVLCHYPMVTWNHKPHGSIMLHGHCHGKMDEYNRISTDLRFDVGLDAALSREVGKDNGEGFGLIPIEKIYKAATAKAGTADFREYANAFYRPEVR